MGSLRWLGARVPLLCVLSGAVLQVGSFAGVEALVTVNWAMRIVPLGVMLLGTGFVAYTWTLQYRGGGPADEGGLGHYRGL